LYLSLYFKQNRQTYYELLQNVRLKSGWLPWLRFFLEGVRDTAQQASDTAKRILAQFDADRSKIEGLGRRAGTAHRLHQLLQKHPILSIPATVKSLKVSAPTARAAVEALKRSRSFRRSRASSATASTPMTST